MQLSTLETMNLLTISGVGVSRVRKIAECLDRLTCITCSASERLESALKQVLKADQLRAFYEGEKKAELELNRLQDDGISVYSLGSAEYPASLATKLGGQAPLLLLCKGDKSLLSKPSVGFCGSRSASEKGLAAAADAASSLAKVNINVVSGYAAGVDLAAHQSALASGGTTTIVMAEGFCRFRLKKELKSTWDLERLLIVSEFGANQPWSVGNAMQRNKTICALSDALLLIEARENGGSIEAGKECLKMQMPLFAAVFEGSPESARGNEAVLALGAKKLMKSRSTNLPNIQPVLEAVHAAESLPGSTYGQAWHMLS